MTAVYRSPDGAALWVDRGPDADDPRYASVDIARMRTVYAHTITEALHLCDVGSICAAIRTHAELLSTTGTTDWVNITIHAPTYDWAGYTDDSADHDRGVRVTPATSTVYCVAPTEYAALIGALRLYVDSYTGTHISDDRAELIALMDRIESGEPVGGES